MSLNVGQNVSMNGCSRTINEAALKTWWSFPL